MLGRWICCVILAGAMVSCGPDKPASEPQANLAAPTAARSPSRAASTSDMPLPPKDAQFTIYCQNINGPNHIEDARLLCQSLRTSSMKDWYVIHSADKSTLYYGFYRTIDPRDPADAREGQRAIKDLNTIRMMMDSSGGRPFSASLPVPLDSPDPAANPAWDLARSGGYYSLEIAVYKGSADRKEAAVESVRAARAQGVEAYYYHGPDSSSVCIGSWPKESAREIDPSQLNTDPNATVFLTPSPLPQDQAQALETKLGMKSVAPQLEPVDPTMIEAMRRFPEHSINGMVPSHRGADPVTGKEIMIPTPSYLVRVPHPEDSEPEIGAPIAQTPANPATPPIPAEKPQPEPSVRQLKSIGE